MQSSSAVALPLYAQLKEEIIAAARRGDLVPGDRLPSQRELVERYRMSHMTVRRAIDDLVREGLVYAIPGKGLYVGGRKQEAEGGPLAGFSEDMASRGMRASSRVLAAEIVGASTILSQGLATPVGTPLVMLRRLRLADDVPMGIQTAYLPHGLCPGLLEHDLERGSLFAILRGVYGLTLAAGTTVAEAALADPEAAALLGLPTPAALLVTEQITFLDDGRPIELARSAYRGDRYRLRVR
jgi:GntR family transcriptional regulator